MHNLTPITALGSFDALVDTAAGMTLCENPNLALASIAARKGHEAQCKKHLTDLLGMHAPGPGKACLHDPETAIWMGPDQWLLSAPFDSHEDLAMRLSSTFGATASVTEQTDAWVSFDLHSTADSDDLASVLELLCNINLRKLEPGDASRTVIHHLGCFVVRLNPKHRLRILGPRASAGSLHHAILTAMRSAL